MAKKPKRHSAGSPKGFGKKDLASQLRKARSLLIQKEWRQALAILTELQQDHPKDLTLLRLLMEAYIQIPDHVKLVGICRQILDLTPNDGATIYNMGMACLKTDLPILGLHTLRDLVQQYPDFEKAAEVESIIATLEYDVNDFLGDLGGAENEENFELGILFEQAKLYIAQADYAKAMEIQQEFLHRRPNFVPARNNLSLLYFTQGKLPEAIETAEQVLDQHPQNIHALSNLCRFCSMTGQVEKAQDYAQRLKTSPDLAADKRMKQVEGLSYLGDDQGVVDIFEAAKADNDLKDQPAFFHHLVAVAFAKLGRDILARKRWRRALDLDPNYTIAANNLENMENPVDYRQSPWSYELNYWFPPDLIQDLSANAAQLQVDPVGYFQALQTKYPYIPHLLRILLDRGDPDARQLAIFWIKSVNSPELLEILKEFVLGTSGSAQDRYHGAVLVYEAGLLDSDRIPFWIGGRKQQVRLLTYDLHNEPLFQHSRKVQNWLRQSTLCLKQGEVEEAETLLLKARQADPQAPDIQNNLAICYRLQGRSEDHKAIIQTLIEDYPDYIIPYLDLATELLLSEGDLDKAEALLQPILDRRRFHYNEFMHLSKAYVLLLQAQQRQQDAQDWLTAWCLLDPLSAGEILKSGILGADLKSVP